MPNDPPYGGRIEVRKNGSVIWQVSAREYPKDRDTDGTLEYAIRMVDASRNMFTSRDGKCLIYIPEPALKSTTESSAGKLTKETFWKFLIVSGYDAPSTPYDEVIIGKSYYITGACYDPESADSTTDPKVPEYHLTIRYDDDDLKQAGLPYDLEPTQLNLCYQNWISLRSALELVEKQAKEQLLSGNSSELPRVEQQIQGLGLNRDRLSKVLTALNIPPEDLNLLWKWGRAETLLEALGINWDLPSVLEKLEMLSFKVNESNVKDLDIWFSRWLPLLPSPTSSQQKPDQVVINAPTISAPIIKGAVVPVPKEGSRAITVKGLTNPGTYALMYPKESDRHSEYSTGH